MTEYQKQTGSTAIYRQATESIAINASRDHVETLLNICYVAMGLADEAGEVLGKIKKLIRDDDGVIRDERKVDIRKELGDVQYYAHELANLFGWDMEEVQAENAAKLSSRKQRGVLNGSGDAR